MNLFKLMSLLIKQPNEDIWQNIQIAYIPLNICSIMENV